LQIQKPHYFWPSARHKVVKFTKKIAFLMKKWMFVATILVAATFSMNAQTYQPPAEVLVLLSKNTCLTCHKMTERSVGPSYAEIATKKYTKKQIMTLIAKPKPEHWPDYAPMAALPSIPKAESAKIAAWIESLGKQ
jgi:cytochrome c